MKGEPRDLIQKYVAQLKKKERKKKWDYKRNESKRTKVLFENVIWTQDATYLREGQKRTYAEVLKDRCTLKIIEAKKVKNLKTENVENILKEKDLPLIYMTDNGSAYCSKKIEKFLEEKQVIHLKSLPATPQHNGGSEIAVREVKKQLEPLEMEGMNLDQSLEKIKYTLNTKRLWQTHGYRTIAEKSRNARLANKEEIRVKMYKEYRKQLMEINKRSPGKFKKRVEERELIYSLLEKYELIKRYRGSRNCVG